MLEALEPIEERWSAELADLDLAVDDVPEVDDAARRGRLGLRGARRRERAARAARARRDRPRGLPSRARIVLYRRPLEARARDGADLADLLHDVLVEQVADYLNVEPDAVDGGETES